MVESLLAYYTSNDNTQPSHLDVIVFTSDFHAARTQAAFEWVLGATPSLTASTSAVLTAPPKTTLVTQSVSSMGIEWASQDAFKDRVTHEEKGTNQIQENALRMRTAADIQSFLLLGGHGGYYKFTHRPREDGLERSQGAGWG